MRPCPYRYLPYLPTRRSSDLNLAGGALVPWRPACTPRPRTSGAAGRRCASRTASGGSRVPDPSSVRGQLQLRSEEHTSELQSRGHLVCRLLLEKKKNTNIAID